MCNAWNHPPGCRCGWGGGDSYYYRTPALPLAITERTSYTSPNASCPVCGASVFFYQSPFGGRVFFDELGPPWPKHPCTDNPTTRGPIYAPYFRFERKPKWLLESWSPALDFSIVRVVSDIYKITLGDSELKRYFACREIDLTKQRPDFVFYRQEDLGFMRINLHWADGRDLIVNGHQTNRTNLLMGRYRT